MVQDDVANNFTLNERLSHLSPAWHYWCEVVRCAGNVFISLDLHIGSGYQPSPGSLKGMGLFLFLRFPLTTILWHFCWHWSSLAQFSYKLPISGQKSPLTLIMPTFFYYRHSTSLNKTWAPKRKFYSDLLIRSLFIIFLNILLKIRRLTSLIKVTLRELLGFPRRRKP